MTRSLLPGRLRSTASLVLLGVFLSFVAIGARGQSLETDVEAGRWLRITRLPSILEDEEVGRQLTSGLTTTFALTVEGRGGSGRGGARVEVRYDLWDEAFQVVALGIDGKAQRTTLASKEALEAWWRGLRLRTLDLSKKGDRPRQVRVTLDVIPFSASEEADTRRWLSDTLSRGSGASPGLETSGQGTFGQVFNVLLATSIRRRALTSYRWTLDVPPGSPS